MFVAMPPIVLHVRRAVNREGKWTSASAPRMRRRISVGNSIRLVMVAIVDLQRVYRDHFRDESVFMRGCGDMPRWLSNFASGLYMDELEVQPRIHRDRD
jgi:hypothetical protein